jgi:hypothetical protein
MDEKSFRWRSPRSRDADKISNRPASPAIHTFHHQRNPNEIAMDAFKKILSGGEQKQDEQMSNEQNQQHSEDCSNSVDFLSSLGDKLGRRVSRRRIILTRTTRFVIASSQTANPLHHPNPRNQVHHLIPRIPSLRRRRLRPSVKARRIMNPLWNGRRMSRS